MLALGPSSLSNEAILELCLIPNLPPNPPVSLLSFWQQMKSQNPAEDLRSTTWPVIQEFLPVMYMGPALSKKGTKKAKSESVLVPAIKWAINTTGCQHRPILAAFQDSRLFFDNADLDCDNCMVRHLINTGDVNNPPTIL